MTASDNNPVSVANSMMAGAFAGMLSRVVVAPLDVIKIRMQVQVEPVVAAAKGAAAGKYRGIAQCAATIVKEEGVRGLWAGTVPALFLWVPYTAVQFAALGEFKRTANKLFPETDPEKNALAFLGGAFAGATATVATYPFDVMRTVLAAQGSPRVYHSLPAVAAGIMKNRGIAGLYAGVGVTLLEIAPASGIQFGVYALLRDSLFSARKASGLENGAGAITRGGVTRGINGGGGIDGDRGETKLNPLANASCGFAAGCVARLIIHPLDVVKKRFQVAGLARSLRYGERVSSAEFRSFASAFGAILKREGVRGFYKGLAPGLIKSAPASAITFAAYDAAIRLLAAREEEKK